MPSRRQFIRIAACSSAALVANSQVLAQAPVLDEKDPQAVALAYVADTTRVNKAKYPKHDATQVCANCQLYQGKATDPLAPCPLFAGKRVAAKGWCSAWVKKAA